MTPLPYPSARAEFRIKAPGFNGHVLRQSKRGIIFQNMSRPELLQREPDHGK
jgi:hypothetical protein